MPIQSIHPACSLALVLLLSLLILPAHAQMHTATDGDFILQSSVSKSTLLAESTLSTHGIEPASDRAVLTVVLRPDQSETALGVAADVWAQARYLTGITREIELKEIRSQGGVSYLGSFDFNYGEVLDILIKATPKSGGQALSLDYRERLWTEEPLSARGR